VKTGIQSFQYGKLNLDSRLRGNDSIIYRVFSLIASFNFFTNEPKFLVERYLIEERRDEIYKNYQDSIKEFGSSGFCVEKLAK